MSKGLDARTAAEMLGVRPQTLYAYVSRGLIRATRQAGQPSLYRREDVEKLSKRKRRGRSAAAVASQALDFGAPVLESGITRIQDGEILVRGRSLVELARSATLEEVAAHLWQAEPTLAFARDNLPLALSSRADHPITRAMSILPEANERDHTALAIEPSERMRVAGRVYRQTLAALAGAEPSALPAHRLYAEAWGRRDRRTQDALRLALVLSADHELNASTFTVRVVTSTAASLYMALCGGLAAMSGSRHGGVSERAWAMLDQLLARRDIEAAVAGWHATGAAFYGFGHPLYPGGDPRAAAIFDWIDRHLPDNADHRALRTVTATVERLIGHGPNVDFALVSLCRLLGLPRLAPVMLFAGGRVAGWIAHALEQSQTAALIRPRARYVGPAKLGETSS